MPARTYSSRLGTIDDAQLAAAVARHGLGQFLRAAPIAGGLFGQNLLLHTTAGEFVLRGAPHWVDGAPNDAWQFGKEAFFAERLHQHTDVPSPWPQWRDRDADLFGWPYVIMPRLPGLCLNDRAIAPAGATALPWAERQGIARALGVGLARLQCLRSPVAGDIDAGGSFAAWPHGHAGHLADDLLRMVEVATANGAFGARERAWLLEAIHAGTSAGSAAGRRHETVAGAVFVHADYKLDNLVLAQAPPAGPGPAGGEASWSVCGVFDLHTACFGLPLLDLCRTACTWLDLEPAFARTFVQAWQAASGTPVIDEGTLRLCLLNERMKIWEYFTRPGLRAAFTAQVPHATDFVRFVEPYLAGLREVAAPTAA